MITTFLFPIVYAVTIGAAGFLMGRVFYRNEKQLRKIETRIKTRPDTGFAKDAVNIRRDWDRVLGVVSQKKP